MSCFASQFVRLVLRCAISGDQQLIKEHAYAHGSFLVFLPAAGPAQLATGAVITLFYLGCNLICRPFCKDGLNNLQSFSLVSQFLTLFCGILIGYREAMTMTSQGAVSDGSLREETKVFGSVIIFINCGTLVFPLVQKVATGKHIELMQTLMAVAKVPMTCYMSWCGGKKRQSAKIKIEKEPNDRHGRTKSTHPVVYFQNTSVDADLVLHNLHDTEVVMRPPPFSLLCIGAEYPAPQGAALAPPPHAPALHRNQTHRPWGPRTPETTATSSDANSRAVSESREATRAVSDKIAISSDKSEEEPKVSNSAPIDYSAGTNDHREKRLVAPGSKNNEDHSMEKAMSRLHQAVGRCTLESMAARVAANQSPSEIELMLAGMRGKADTPSAQSLFATDMGKRIKGYQTPQAVVSPRPKVSATTFQAQAGNQNAGDLEAGAAGPAGASVTTTLDHSALSISPLARQSPNSAVRIISQSLAHESLSAQIKQGVEQRLKDTQTKLAAVRAQISVANNDLMQVRAVSKAEQVQAVSTAEQAQAVSTAETSAAELAAPGGSRKLLKRENPLLPLKPQVAATESAVQQAVAAGESDDNIKYV